MKILHTSDWHLGKSLYGRRRHEEYRQFLSWLSATIIKEEIRVLLVCGDIFDTTTPGNRTMALYYDFLRSITHAGQCDVVIIAGNHDSPTLLEAPRTLLSSMGIHVIGQSGQSEETTSSEIITIGNWEQPELLVCAVPYLRDRDIRTVEAGESVDDKCRKLVEGVLAHYHQISRQAEELRRGSPIPDGSHLPIIATGHLFTAGGQVREGDGVRDLYIGSLAQIPTSAFPDCFQYIALGHLHAPQRAGGLEHCRYSGSPLPMSFDEAERGKQVLIAEIMGGEVHITPLTVPVFQKLARIKGNLGELTEQIDTLRSQNESIWLEVIYTGEQPQPTLADLLAAHIADSPLEILRVVNLQMRHAQLASQDAESLQSLDDLSVDDVFTRCLESNNIAEDLGRELSYRFREAQDTLQQRQREN